MHKKRADALRARAALISIHITRALGRMLSRAPPTLYHITVGTIDCKNISLEDRHGFYKKGRIEIIKNN